MCSENLRLEPVRCRKTLLTVQGKTMAFLLPVIEDVAKQQGKESGSIQKKPLRSLVICPVRELATQIFKEVKRTMRYHKGVRTMIFIGGVSVSYPLCNDIDLLQVEKDIEMFKKCTPNIVIATPGRLEELLRTNADIAKHFSKLKVEIRIRLPN